MRNSDRIVRRLQWLHLIGLMLFALVGLMSGKPPVWAGLMIGGLIALVNFQLLVRICASIAGMPGSRPNIGARALLKQGGLLTVLSVILLGTSVDPLSFVIGLSLTVASIMWIGTEELILSVIGTETGNA